LRAYSTGGYAGARFTSGAIGLIYFAGPRLIQAIRKGPSIENSFIVSAVSWRMRKLICYGANLRLEVDIADAVLV